jgi:hypothetical protein
MNRLNDPNRSIPRNHSDRADTLNLKAIPRDANPRASACAADFALRRHIETVFAIGEMVLVFADARRQIRRPRLAVTNGRVKSQLFGTVALGTVALLRVDRRYAGHHRSAKHHDENTGTGQARRVCAPKQAGSVHRNLLCILHAL